MPYAQPGVKKYFFGLVPCDLHMIAVPLPSPSQPSPLPSANLTLPITAVAVCLSFTLP